MSKSFATILVSINQHKPLERFQVKMRRISSGCSRVNLSIVHIKPSLGQQVRDKQKLPQFRGFLWDPSCASFKISPFLAEVLVPHWITIWIFYVILRLFQVFFQSRWDRQAVDKITPDVPQNDKATDVLKRMHVAQSWYRKEQLNRCWRQTRSPRSEKVEELATAWVLHGLLDELNDCRSAVWLWLGVETEHT